MVTKSIIDLIVVGNWKFRLVIALLLRKRVLLLNSLVASHPLSDNYNKRAFIQVRHLVSLLDTTFYCETPTLRFWYNVIRNICLFVNKLPDFGEIVARPWNFRKIERAPEDKVFVKQSLVFLVIFVNN